MKTTKKQERNILNLIEFHKRNKNIKFPYPIDEEDLEEIEYEINNPNRTLNFLLKIQHLLQRGYTYTDQKNTRITEKEIEKLSKDFLEKGEDEKIEKINTKDYLLMIDYIINDFIKNK